MAEPPATETVTIVLDGREVTAAKGEMIIAAAERAGVYIPRFCYHPRMKPVGMCRMCLVDVKGPRGYALTPACFVSVSDGQEIVTTSPAVKKAQDGVLEFLLVNHPLDCPVCDKGGECPLQDQTFAFGPGETRFVEEKRHWEKPIELSPLVLLDRERCIQCARCTRFAEEIAGDPLIDFAMRGDHIEVATFPDEPFASYFSGNTVQICPVGALTSVPYRFRARPWDLEQVESSCTSCAVGCRVAVQSSGERLTRYLGIDSDPVNQSWMCDKGRFDFEAVNSEERLTAPLVRKGDELVEASWSEALAKVADGLADIIKVRGGSSIGLIGGARLANEDAYAWSKLARTVLGTDHVDAQLGDGLDAEAVLGLPRATIDQACRASAVILLGPDLKEELPILYLRLRHAAVEDHLPIVELAVRRSGLSRYAAATLLHRPGEAALLARALVAPEGPANEVAGVPAAQIEAARRLLARARPGGAPASGSDPGAAAGDAAGGDGGEGIVVVLGRPSLADSGASVTEAASILAAGPGVRFLSALRRANVHGALDMGLAPGVLPGRVSLDDGRAWYEAAWGTALPAEPGFDTSRMLAAASEGRLAALILLGADPVADFPDRTMALQGLDGVGFVVAVDCFLTESSSRADVVLPAATYAERPGTFTNQEFRITRLGQKITPPGVAWPDWMIAVEIAAMLGRDLGFENLESIWAEVERTSPVHRGLTAERLALRSSGDGLLAPLATGEGEGVEPGTGRPGGGPAAHEMATDAGGGVDQAPPAPIDPMSDPGIGSVETHGVPATSLAAENPASGERMGELGDANPADPAPAGAGAGGGGAGGAGGPGDADDAGPPPRPPLIRWAGAERGAEVPRRDSYSLRLIATRCLWDAGTLVRQSPHLVGLAPAQALRVNQYDLDRLGVASGGRVRAISPRASLVLDVMADPGLPRGTAALTFNLPGEGPASLIDATAAVTDVRLETL